MNAVEQSLASARNRAPVTALPDEPEPAAAEAAPALAEGRAVDRWLLTRLHALVGSPAIEIAVRDGASISPPGAVARLTFANRAALLAVLADPALRFGDAYSAGDATVEGDLVGFLETVYRAGHASAERASFLQRAAEVLHRPHRNSLAGSRDNIHRHYDIGNDFYALWLGSTMAYTCAYYPTPTATLDEAQLAKMDHVCRKLRLRSGESVVEAGCGWGTLALHMARRYGVRVRAFNISHEQISYARERAARDGLTGSVEYVEDDYRNITGRYDAFVSVGMLEHVGLANYATLGAIVQRSLGGRGRGLIHSIGRNQGGRLQPWIERRIFPGGHAPTLAEMMRIFEPCNLSILDVENLRLHYAQTLRHWLGLYEAVRERVRAQFDEKFVRMWRLYLAGSVAAFSTGSMQLFQVVFAPGTSNDIPWTRADLYTH